ncbi:MAG: hypothetical protein JXA71_04595 [Chitinispirillaceae bacterium]|nr:hypothetical protein [Chitinispirillaceae bacterium]
MAARKRFSRQLSRQVILHVAILASITAATGQTGSRLEGDISAITFSKEGNPFVVNGETVVPQGSSVTIGPGCVFLFKDYSALKVQGVIEVNGDSIDPVIFSSFKDQAYNKSSQEAANQFDWNGITIARGAGRATLHNFKLMYSVFGVKCENSDMEIVNGLFRQNSRSGLAIGEKDLEVNENTLIAYSISPPAVQSGDGAQFLDHGDATLFVETDPAGAIVTIENHKIDKATPFRLDSIKAGQYTLLARKDLLVGSLNITLEQAEAKKVLIKLDKQKTAIRVITEPPDAEVFVEKKITRRAKPDLISPGLLKQVPEQKTVLISFFRPGYCDTAISLPLTPFQVNNVFIELKAADEKAKQAQKSFLKKRKLARTSIYFWAGSGALFAATGGFAYAALKDYDDAREAKEYLETTIERQGPYFDSMVRENADKAASGNKNRNVSVVFGALGMAALATGLVFYF